MRNIAHYILLSCLRDRLLAGWILLLLGTALLFGFLGGLTIIETDQSQRAFAAHALRLCLVFGALIFTVFHTRQMVQTREIIVLLSRPVSHASFIIGYGMALLLVSLTPFLLCCVLVLVFGFHTITAYAHWAIGLYAELWIATIAGLSFGLISRHAMTGLLGASCFYLLSRWSVLFTLIAQSTAETSPNLWNQLGRYTIEALHHLLPRLDAFAPTHMLLYGNGALPLAQIALQTALYSGIFLCIILVDMRRKDW